MPAAARPPGAALALRILLPFLLHALARDVDAAVGVLLHTSLDLPRFVPRALALVDLAAAARHAALWVVGGAALWAALALRESWAAGRPRGETSREACRGFAVLYLRPALTLLALVSLAARPAYPYAFTLPVALGQDLSVAQDAAALAALVAAHWPRRRWPVPGAASMAFMAFVAYSLLTPESARHWEGHPGNEPKTLRMAVALGHGLTLDVEGVSAGMEALPTRPILDAAGAAAGTLARESAHMMAALVRGPRAVGASAIRATRVARQTIRGKDGGVYHVLAPGPSFLIAPALRVDRALNLRRGTPGRLAVTVTLWNALAASLVAAVFLLARESGAGGGPAATVAALAALLPPLVFYSYQFYPEMLGALALAVALRAILLRRWDGSCRALPLGLLLAALPWLHQKFLPVWALLVAIAVVRAVDGLVPLRTLLALLLPQALSLYLIALYNFAIAGSVRPDALFLAWGPGGVSSARWGQGLLGLSLDARYGLLPYVPLYLFALGGLVRPGVSTRVRWGLPVALVYYLTVAAADNWSGAVCNLGRYVMPAVPYAAGLVALVAALARVRAGLLALLLALAGWSALVARTLWLDPHAANDCALLLARSAIADGSVYIPNLFIRTWAEGAPGLWARIAVWIVLAVVLAWWVRRASRAGAAARPAAAVFALAAVLLVAAALLERWPSPRASARFSDAVEVAPGVTAFVEGARVEGERAWLPPGEHVLLLRARDGGEVLRIRAEGEGVLTVRGRPPLVLSDAGLEVDVPLELVAALEGRRGVTETLWRQRLALEATRPVALRLALASVRVR